MDSLHKHTNMLVYIVKLRQETMLETEEGQLGLVGNDRRADFSLSTSKLPSFGDLLTMRIK
jgi:hypothetical protein